MSDILTRSDTDAITTLTLNDPTTLNSLSVAMLVALSAQLFDIATGPQKVVILRGAGKAFCAGHNLREMQAMRQASDGGAAGFADLFDRCTAVMSQIRALPQPVIAQVHGLATAAGCQLVATCDLAVAHTDTRFGVNGVNIGLFCSTPMVALSRNIPRKHAFQMLSTGSFISAAQAAEAGLINTATDSPDADAQALAATLAAKLHAAVRIGKSAFYDQMEMPVEQAYDLTRAAMLENLALRDTDEGMQAFVEKRAPDWS
jgi:enoyl-CoA hydratase/carnithine racemase